MRLMKVLWWKRQPDKRIKRELFESPSNSVHLTQQQKEIDIVLLNSTPTTSPPLHELPILTLTLPLPDLASILDSPSPLCALTCPPPHFPASSTTTPSPLTLIDPLLAAASILPSHSPGYRSPSAPDPSLTCSPRKPLNAFPPFL